MRDFIITVLLMALGGAIGYSYACYQISKIKKEQRK